MDQKQFPLNAICQRWIGLLKAADGVKEKEFSMWAREASNFFDGPNHNWMFEDVYSKGANGFLQDDGGSWLPNFRMSVNRLFEAVSLFGPVLYHQNPVVEVTPRKRVFPSVASFMALPADPASLQMQYQQMAQQNMASDVMMKDHAGILSAYANWLQIDTDKKNESRHAIQEAIVTGLGLLETKLITAPGSSIKTPHSQFRSSADLQVDPDAKYWRDVQWIALRNVSPVHEVAEKYGIPLEWLEKKGTLPSQAARSQGIKSSNRHGDGKEVGISHDLIEYWEIYSKNGIGNRLRRSAATKGILAADPDPDWCEELGSYTYMVIAKDIPFPLNISPNVTTQGLEAIQDAAMWPIPFWTDRKDGGWPISRLYFHEKAGQVWPITMCKPAIPELRFLNWCMSFLADKTAASCRTIIGMQKAAADEIRRQLLRNEGPFTILELPDVLGGDVNKLVNFLQAPSFHVDIWRMLTEVMEQVDKRLGLTELVYGMSSHQMRSAAEANQRYGALNVRPDDMASKTEDWLGATATRELQALRWGCSFEDTAPVIGDAAATVFEVQIKTQDIGALTRDFEFTIATGSARKPNKDAKIQQMNEFGQYFLPVASQLVAAGQIGPLNAFLADYATALDLDPGPYLLQPMAIPNDPSSAGISPRTGNGKSGPDKAVSSDAEEGGVPEDGGNVAA